MSSICERWLETSFSWLWDSFIIPPDVIGAVELHSSNLKTNWKKFYPLVLSWISQCVMDSWNWQIKQIMCFQCQTVPDYQRVLSGFLQPGWIKYGNIFDVLQSLHTWLGNTLQIIYKSSNFLANHVWWPGATQRKTHVHTISPFSAQFSPRLTKSVALSKTGCPVFVSCFVNHSPLLFSIHRIYSIS